MGAARGRWRAARCRKSPARAATSSRRSPCPPLEPCHGQPDWLRSTVTPKGDHHKVDATDTIADQDVAIHGHAGGRPPLARCRYVTDWTVVLRSTAAPEGDRHSRCPGRHQDGQRGCDPRSPRRATATSEARLAWSAPMPLRSTVIPEGDRHRRVRSLLLRRGDVAILGRPGGRPSRPHAHPRRSPGDRCDPQPVTSATAMSSCSPSSSGPCGCDSRPSQRATATPGDRLGRPRGRPPRSAWTRCGAQRRSCDPRSPRRETATPLPG